MSLQVGEQKLGKTMWIRNLQTLYKGNTYPYSSDKTERCSDCSSNTEDEVEAFVKDPSKSLTEVTVEDAVTKITHRISIQVWAGHVGVVGHSVTHRCTA